MKEELGLRIVVCDDEEKERASLRQLLVMELNAAHVDCYASGDDLLEAGKKYNLIFLDIEMPGTSGMETARRLRRDKRGDLLVFLTAYDRYMPSAFEVKAFRYLLKPWKREDIASVLRAAYQEILDRQLLAVPLPDKAMTALPLNEIRLLESLGDQSCIYTADQKVISPEPLKYWEKQLDSALFGRVSRQYIVAYQHISDLKHNQLYLAGLKQPILLPRRQVKAVEAAWLDYLRFYAQPL